MKTKQIIISVSFGLLAILAIIGLYHILKPHDNPSPVKDIDNTNVMTARNDTIKDRIQTLDSIKYETIQEVLSLDYDSTLNLFYKLVSK